jgi:hypothetical protein
MVWHMGFDEVSQAIYFSDHNKQMRITTNAITRVMYFSVLEFFFIAASMANTKFQKEMH